MVYCFHLLYIAISYLALSCLVNVILLHCVVQTPCMCKHTCSKALSDSDSNILHSLSNNIMKQECDLLTYLFSVLIQLSCKQLHRSNIYVTTLIVNHMTIKQTFFSVIM